MKKYDVIVAGGGFAGVGAALAAAKAGVSVLLVEKSNCLGGSASNALVQHFMKYYTIVDGKQLDLSRGVFAEITAELAKENSFIGKSTFDEEILKSVLNRMLISRGVDILFHACFTGADCEDGLVKSIRVSYKGNDYILKASCFIDATGDADIACSAGFPFRVGRDGDNLCQPMTLCFRVGNVDMEKYRACAKEIQRLYVEYKKDGKIKNPLNWIIVCDSIHHGILHFNSTRLAKLNPVELLDISRAEIEGREQVFELFGFLKANFDCFADSYVLQTACDMGIREGRMIDGEHILTVDELKAFTKFEDGIAAGNYDIDIHDPVGGGISHWLFPDGEYYTIPYRSLIPKNSKNLLVAGRCISTTHEAQASIRIMPIVCTLGEAAGTAAAIACRDNLPVKEIDIKKLRSTLIENNVFLDR